MLNSPIGPRLAPLTPEPAPAEPKTPALAAVPQELALPGQTLRHMAMFGPRVAPDASSVGGLESLRSDRPEPSPSPQQSPTPVPTPLPVVVPWAMTIEKVTVLLDQHFGAFDTAAKGGSPDDKIGQDDLQAVAANVDGKFTLEQQDAAQFLLNSRASRNFLDKAVDKGWGLDGVIGREDVTAAKRAIADGSYTHRMLDTAASDTGWFAGPNGEANPQEIDAALKDLGIPHAVKDAIGLAREGKPDADLGFLSGLTASKAKAASELVRSPGYRGLSADEKRMVAETWRESQGESFVAGVFERIVQRPGFAPGTAAERADRLREMALMRSEDFKALSPSDQQVLYEALDARRAGDAHFTRKLGDLLSSASFKSLSADEKTAVLSQVRNYPSSAVASNLDRLLDKAWFQGMPLADTQRSLKTIAYMTDYPSGDRTILDNTLNKLLDPSQHFTLEWQQQPAGTGAYYTPGTGRVSMNEADVPADNQPVVGSTSVWQIVNAAPHEINHAIDDAGPLPTYAYLDKEYQAYYTGTQAQNGQPMTRDEAVDLWNNTLLNTNDIYGTYAAGALADTAQAQQIFDFLSRLTGVAVTAADYQAVLADSSLWNPPYDPSTGPDIAIPADARPQGNTDNR